MNAEPLRFCVCGACRERHALICRQCWCRLPRPLKLRLLEELRDHGDAFLSHVRALRRTRGMEGRRA